MVVPVALGGAAATLEMTGGTLLTVTATGAEVAWLPEGSVASAASVWLPLPAPAVFQLRLKGGLVRREPRLAPSSSICTEATVPLLSLALAATVTVPETVDPAAGAVTATVGGVVSVEAGLSATRSAAVGPAEEAVAVLAPVAPAAGWSRS